MKEVIFKLPDEVLTLIVHKVANTPQEASLLEKWIYDGEERKTGKWEVKLMRHFAHLLICSNCGAALNITAEEHLRYYKRNFRYCPYCGAKMEVDE